MGASWVGALLNPCPLHIFCRMVHIKWLQVCFLFGCHGLEAVLCPGRDVAVPFTPQLRAVLHCYPTLAVSEAPSWGVRETRGIWSLPGKLQIHFAASPEPKFIPWNVTGCTAAGLEPPASEHALMAVRLPCNLHPFGASYFCGVCPLCDARARLASCHPQSKLPLHCINICAVSLARDLISSSLPRAEGVKNSKSTTLHSLAMT